MQGAAVIGAAGAGMAAIGIVQADAEKVLGLPPLAWFLGGLAGFGFLCAFQNTYRCPRCSAFVGSLGVRPGLTLWATECPGCRAPLT